MLLLESLSIIVALHYIFNKKIRFSVSILATILCHVIYLFEVNYRELHNVYTVAIYAVYIIFCIMKFNVSVSRATLAMCICIIVMTIMQFGVLLGISIVPIQNESVRAIIINGIVLLLCVLMVPKLRLYNLEKWITVRSKIMYWVIGFAIIVITTILYQNKFLEGIQVELYIFAAPAVYISIVLAEKWINYKNKSEILESELQAKNKFQVSYDKMLKDMRIRQHNFNNQIQTIVGTHYIYKTYEDLVRAQGELCKIIQKDNKYNKLLWLGSNVVSGFLFMKLQEIEDKGISVELKINSSGLKTALPEYLLIEMIGILLDNAIDATVEQTDSKQIILSISQRDNLYGYKVANRIRYVSYDEINSWFELGKSSKEDGRGIGLYRVKQICSENDCNIVVRNITNEDGNWIEFTLEVKTGF